MVSIGLVSSLEDVVSDVVDGVGLGALEMPMAQHVLVDVQDVAALDVEGVVAARQYSGVPTKSG